MWTVAQLVRDGVQFPKATLLLLGLSQPRAAGPARSPWHSGLLPQAPAPSTSWPLRPEEQMHPWEQERRARWQVASVWLSLWGGASPLRERWCKDG